VSYSDNDNSAEHAPTEYAQVQRVPDAVVPKQRSSAILRVLGSLLGIAVLSCFALIGAFLWAYSAFTAAGPLPDTKTVQLAKSMTRLELATKLQDEGIISDSRIFGAALGLTSLAGSGVKTGEYEFSKSASMEDVLSILRQGRTITYKLTVPEGWTAQMAVNRLNEHEALSGEPITALPSEGAIMADTFVFQRGMSRQELLQEMQLAQQKMLDAVWQGKPADTIVKSKEELVTLASIVEKETGKADERPLVAAVFLNRLKKGMRLQSDPTIIYGIVGSKGKLERSLTREDIATETPYNTYRINGLPPGPIASPGRASLEAVLKPAQVEYLYFVADGTGGHAFATTLEEHNQNVAKWRKIEAGEAPAPVPGKPQADTNSATGLEGLNLEPAVDPAAQPAAEAQPAEASVAEEAKPEEGKPAEPAKAEEANTEETAAPAVVPAAIKKPAKAKPEKAKPAAQKKPEAQKQPAPKPAAAKDQTKPKAEAPKKVAKPAKPEAKPEAKPADSPPPKKKPVVKPKPETN
jgi:UPF0755 protein